MFLLKHSLYLFYKSFAISKLFKPFSQVDASITRKFGGTGLGLMISQKLLQLMGGEFRVTSKQGQGTTVSFDMLLGIGELKHTRDPFRRIKQGVGKLKQDLQQLATELKGSRILVVEDNTINQQVLKGFLVLSGIEVFIADNGQEALNLLDQQTFDAILMDVHMPVMGGVEATKRIRLDQKYLNLPIIALTAGVTQEERDKCLASGMNDFIAKPINPESLITTLTKWVKLTKLAENHTSTIVGSALENVPYFDLKNLLDMVGNNQELIEKLLQTFAADIKKQKIEIEAMLCAGNLISARELVHNIKGASSNLGAMQLYDSAGALETKLKDEQIDPEILSVFYTSCTQAIAAVDSIGRAL